MAGRGTDIVLGGNAEYMALSDLRRAGVSEELLAEANSFAETEDPEVLDVRSRYKEAYAAHKVETSAESERVKAAGGLFILGTERHESRRIDNQLRGRSGRQGDPGETRFYLSLQDDVMRLFGSDRIMSMMDTLKIDEDTPIDAKILSGAIENAQKTVESRNFQARKNVLEYDDVMNTQRTVIYDQRRQVLDGEDLRSAIAKMMKNVIAQAVHGAYGEQNRLGSEEQLSELLSGLASVFPKTVLEGSLSGLGKQEMEDRLLEKAEDIYRNIEQMNDLTAGKPVQRELERVIMLRVVDEYWMDQIDAMSDLKQGIQLRAYGQTDPVIAYKKEGYEMFESMIAAIQEETVRRLFLARVKPREEVKRKKVATVTQEGAANDKTVKRQPVRRTVKVGPNDPCPCGSGKKYKKCCRDKDLAKLAGHQEEV